MLYFRLLTLSFVFLLAIPSTAREKSFPADSSATPLLLPNHKLDFNSGRLAHSSKIDKQRLYLVSGFTGAWMIGTYVVHIKPWWSGEKSGFRVKYDWWNNTWLEVDKFGHFYSNILTTEAVAASFEYAGVSKRKALWIGAINSTVLFTSFELTDAGFEDWGFSVPDYVANVLGAAYPILQDIVPVFEHFNFKLGYWPSRYYNATDNSQPGFINYSPYTYPSGDYDGMTYWLSADVNWMLPQAAKPYWPDWLNLAVGYGARDLPQANDAIKIRELYIGFDYNLEAINTDHALLNTLLSAANTLHFPAPAIRIDNTGNKLFLFQW
ncbi:MAG: DUF2279 domain-containing protein [Calditrichia bacterium]